MSLVASSKFGVLRLSDVLLSFTFLYVDAALLSRKGEGWWTAFTRSGCDLVSGLSGAVCDVILGVQPRVLSKRRAFSCFEVVKQL